jgi:hypothetical protein
MALRAIALHDSVSKLRLSELYGSEWAQVFAGANATECRVCGARFALWFADRHLFVESADKFGWKANTWEELVLREEMKGKTYAGWLRNIPKRAWALCVPYGQGQPKAMYPDMLVFRREGKKIKSLLRCIGARIIVWVEDVVDKPEARRGGSKTSAGRRSPPG